MSHQRQRFSTIDNPATRLDIGPQSYFHEPNVQYNSRTSECSTSVLMNLHEC